MGRPFHVVRSGESLASIARREYGAERLWPSIYAHTNVLAARGQRGFSHIADPNRIRVGDHLALPPIPISARQPLARHPRVVATVPIQLAEAGQPSGVTPPSAPLTMEAPRQGPGPHRPTGNPAETVPLGPFYGWVYKLDDIKPYEVVQNGFRITVKLKGEFSLQPREGTPLLKLSNKDGQVDLQRRTETVVGELLTDYQLAYDGASKRVKFACRLTQVGQGGAPDIGAIIPTPPDVFAEFISWKTPIRGTFMGQSFLVNKFSVEIGIAVDQEPPGPPSAPLTLAQPRADAASSIDWGQVGARVLLLGILGVGLFFFCGPEMAVVALVVAGFGLGIWGEAEAKGRSGPITGVGRATPAFSITVYAPEAR